MKESMLGSNPYVGPRAFREGEELRGRKQELLRLLHLIIAERVVILYSPSGAGKTSLIQAGLIPELKKKNFRILGPIRVGRGLSGEEFPPLAENRYLSSLLLSLDYQPLAGQQIPQNLAGCLEQLAQDTDTPSDEVLIFDQFEEILTLDPTDIKAKEVFFDQIGEVLQARHRWALFSLREEYLAALEPYAHFIPTRFQNSFRLDLLSMEAACEAIREPADKAGVDFTDKAAQKLVQDLCKVRVQLPDGSFVEQTGPHVEPVQLQVVCQRLWENHQTQWEKLPPAERKIIEQDLEDFGDVNTALAHYYAERVAAVARDTQVPEREVREWFDRHLITSRGIRGQVLLGESKLDEKAIHALVDAHLVRRDERHGAIWFELAHDRLIRPITENNEAWFKKNLTTLQLQAELWNRLGRPNDLLVTGREYTEAKKWATNHPEQMTNVEKDFLARSKDKRRRNRLFNVLAIGVFLTGLIAFYFGFLAEQHARLAESGQKASQAFALLLQDPELSLDRALKSVEEAKSVRENILINGDLRKNKEKARLQAENALHRVMLSSRLICRPAGPPANKGDKKGPSHQQEIFQVLVSPNDQRFATVSQDMVKIWDVNGELLNQLRHDQARVNRASFSPDGSLLVTACNDKTAKIWNLKKNDMQPLEHNHAVQSVYFNKDGNYLASVITNEDKVTIWDAHEENFRKLVSLNHNDLTAMAFTPDGQSVATAGWDGDVLVWQLPSGDKRKDIKIKHGRQLNRLYFNSQGTLLATISAEDGMVKVWEFPSGNQLWPQKIQSEDVNKLFNLEAAFSPDGKLLALAKKCDHKVVVLNIATGQFKTILPGHTETITKLIFLPPEVSPNGRFLISASDDGTIKLWDTDSNRELFSLAGHKMPVKDIAISSEGNQLISVGWDKQVRVWDIRVGHTAFVNQVAFNRKDNQLATFSCDATVRLWDINTGKQLKTWAGENGQIQGMALNPGKEELITSNNTGTLSFASLNGKELYKIELDEILKETLKQITDKNLIIQTYSLNFSPSGKYVMLQSLVALDYYQSKILLFSPPAGLTVIPPFNNSYTFSSMTISSDENHLATGLTNGKILVWDLKNPRHPEELIGHRHPVLSVAFHPEGKYLASGSKDMTVKLWKLNDNKSWTEIKLASLAIFNNGVNSVAFSHDGSQFAAGSTDRTVKVFKLDFEHPEIMQLMHKFSHAAGINYVAFSYDDSKLATGCCDNHWYIHPLKSEDAETQARQKLEKWGLENSKGSRHD